MIFDFFDSLSRVFSIFPTILNFFTIVKNMLEELILNISIFDFLGPITPYIGTIRFIAGELVYLTLARSLQIGMFLLLVKTLYQLITILVNSLAVQKPLSIIKKFIGL